MKGTPLDAARLTKHAMKYGTEGVMQTAAESGFPFEVLVDLQKVVDDLDAQKHRFKPRPRLSAETRVKRLLGIEDETEDQ